MKVRSTAVALSAITLAISFSASGHAHRPDSPLPRAQSARESLRATKADLLGRLMHRRLTVTFDETPARDAIDHLRRASGVPIVARYLDGRASVGIDPEAMITLEVDDQPVLLIIESLLEQATDLDPMTWQIRRGFVEVGPKARLAASSAQELRYYAIRDITFEVPTFDNAPDLDLDAALNQGRQHGGGGSGTGSGSGVLFDPPDDERPRLDPRDSAADVADLIRDLVEPDAWRYAGGNWASIRYHNGVLMVRAPDFIHRQLGGYPRPTAATLP